MNSPRDVANPAPPHEAVEPAGIQSAIIGSLDTSISGRARIASVDSYAKQKMAAVLRTCLLAKHLRNDNVPCELQQGLYLGSIGAAFNKRLLQSLNVTHILSVASAMDMPFPRDFKYLRIEVMDSPDVNLAQHFDRCFAFIDEARMRGGGVLVHCFAGMSRSVTVSVAYLMKTYEMRLSQALSHVTSRRREARPNPGFMKQLQNYERQLEVTRIQHSDSPEGVQSQMQAKVT